MLLYVSSKNLPERTHRHIGCIYLSFLHCVFSNVSSNCLPEKTHSYTGCTCVTSLQCVFSNVPSKHLDQSRQNHTGCICLTFRHCVFSNESSNDEYEGMQSHTDSICLTFLQCVFSNVSSISQPRPAGNGWFGYTLVVWSDHPACGVTPQRVTVLKKETFKKKSVSYFLSNLSCGVTSPQPVAGQMIYLMIKLHAPHELHKVANCPIHIFRLIEPPLTPSLRSFLWW